MTAPSPLPPLRHPAPHEVLAGEMRAVVQSAYGEADVLRLDQIARPAIKPREVLVQVRAAGLDRGTWHLMAGKPYAARLVLGLRAPRYPVPGRDLAGVVAAVGNDVTRFRPGDEVFGIGKGSFAEFAIAPEKKLVAKPASLTFEQAAAIPISGITALRGLRDSGRLKAGQSVLITGASGGVGTFAVQIAKALGADVTAVCSGAKADLVSSLGADRVIDYTQEDFADEDRRYDLILDIAGGASVPRLRRALTPRGTLVIVGSENGGRWLGVGRQLRAAALSPFVRQRLVMLVATENRRDIERLLELVTDGGLTPAIGRTYPLSEAPSAMKDLVEGNARGKLVITPAAPE